MSIVHGLNILVTIQRRIQQPDDLVGGSVQEFETIKEHCPARIGSPKTPFILRAQGIEVTNIYDCTILPPDYFPMDIRIDDLIVVETGQYAGRDFAVTSIQDDSLADDPTDLRQHKSLSIRRFERARKVQ